MCGCHMISLPQNAINISDIPENDFSCTCQTVAYTNNLNYHKLFEMLNWFFFVQISSLIKVVWPNILFLNMSFLCFDSSIFFLLESIWIFLFLHLVIFIFEPSHLYLLLFIHFRKLKLLMLRQNHNVILQNVSQTASDQTIHIVIRGKKWHSYILDMHNRDTNLFA